MYKRQGSTDPNEAFERLVRHERHIAGWSAILATLSPLDRAVLQLLADGHAPLARDSIATVRKTVRDATPSKVRTALERLRRAGLVTSSARRSDIEDPLLLAFLKRPSLLR